MAAFNGAGTFVRSYNWVNDAANAIAILPDRFDTEMDGIATGLSTCILKDGTQTITADIPWNSKKITGLGTPSVGDNTATAITSAYLLSSLASPPAIGGTAAAAGTFTTLTATTTVATAALTASGTSGLAAVTATAPSAGDNSTRVPTTAFVAAMLRGYLNGLTLSNDSGTPNTIFDIAAGVATSSDNTTFMLLASAYTKTSSAWAVGTGNGGLDTGAFAASTCYHVWLIERTDTQVVDVLFSTSVSSPTMPANYTKKRRIGSLFTDGSTHFKTFVQNGDTFLWMTPVNDFTGTPFNTASLKTLSVPTGVKVQVLGSVFISSDANIAVSSPDQTDYAPGNTAGPVRTSGGQVPYLPVWTNTSAQLRFRMDITSGTFDINTMGWIDLRGRL